MTNARSSSFRRRLTVSLLAGLGLSLVVGCSSSQDREPLTRHEQVLNNLTPELKTLYERDIDVANILAYTDNTNSRAMHGDLLRAFYRERPSRLHNAPSPY